METAIRSGKDLALAAMLEAGADPQMTNRLGQTAFHTAALEGSVRSLELLLPNLDPTKDKILEMRDNAGDTPVHCASRGDHFAAISLFLEYAVMEDDRDESGRSESLTACNDLGESALLVACASRSFRVARRLLELGAEPYAVDYIGQVSLSLYVGGGGRRGGGGGGGRRR